MAEIINGKGCCNTKKQITDTCGMLEAFQYRKQ